MYNDRITIYGYRLLSVRRYGRLEVSCSHIAGNILRSVYTTDNGGTKEKKGKGKGKGNEERIDVFKSAKSRPEYFFGRLCNMMRIEKGYYANGARFLCHLCNILHTV